MGMVLVVRFAANATCPPVVPKLNQIRRKFRQAIRLLLGKPIFDDDVFFSTQPSLRISRQNAPNTNCPN